MPNKKTKNIVKTTINSTNSKLIKSIENHINDNVLLKLKFNHITKNIK